MDFKIGDRTIYKSKFNKRESKIVEINGVIINGYQYIKIKHIDKSYSDEWVIKNIYLLIRDIIVIKNK